MLTFMFVEKNDSGTLFIDANSYEEALEKLSQKVKEVEAWRCNDENGEENDQEFF